MQHKHVKNTPAGNAKVDAAQVKTGVLPGAQVFNTQRSANFTNHHRRAMVRIHTAAKLAFNLSQKPYVTSLVPGVYSLERKFP